MPNENEERRFAPRKCERCGCESRMLYPRIYHVYGQRMNGLVCPRCRDEIDWAGAKSDER